MRSTRSTSPGRGPKVMRFRSWSTFSSLLRGVVQDGGGEAATAPVNALAEVSAAAGTGSATSELITVTRQQVAPRSRPTSPAFMDIVSRHRILEAPPFIFYANPSREKSCANQEFLIVIISL